MSKRNSTALKIALALAAAMLAVGVSFSGKMPAARAAQQDLPEGKGVELARDKCVICHEADVIVAQRLTRQGWTREVEKMIRWGAPVKDAEKEILVDYFSSHFALTKPAAAAVAASEARGKQIFEDQCLVCHEADVTEGQRLTRQGWTREVEKMIRWGAKVADVEKESLVDYLSKNYGLRPLTSTR